MRLLRRQIAGWGATVLLISGLHLLTLTISPPIWEDEVQIIDYGRSFLAPSTTWSVSLARTGRPLRLFTYVGGLFQELAYQLTHSPVGPRISGIVGGVAAATTLLCWLRRRGVSFSGAWLLSTAFLLDPAAVASYRGARVDCWAIAWCLLGCIFAREASRVMAGTRRLIVATSAGAAVTIGFFVWAPALLVCPLALIELWTAKVDFGQFSRSFICLCAGAALAAILLLLPLIPVWSQGVSDLHALAATTAVIHQSRLSIVDNAREFLGAMKLSPIVLIAGLASLLFLRDRFLCCFGGLLLAYLLATKVYPERVLYLLPVLFAALGELHSHMAANPLKFPKRFASASAIAMVAWGAAISLGARSTFALLQREGRDPSALLDAAKRDIGDGPKRIFVDSWEFYYAGRALGWQILRPFELDSSGHLGSAPFEGAALSDFVKDVDFAVLAKKDPLAGRLAESGMSQIAMEPLHSAMQNSEFGGNPFGPYVFFRRTASQPQKEESGHP